MHEVALWEDMLKVVGDELFYPYVVANQTIVIPETIAVIRTLKEIETDGANSIFKNNESLGVN